MKLIRPRSSRAPCPISVTKRLCAMRTERSVSNSCRRSAICQCSSRPSSTRGVPQRRTSTLSSSLRPSGHASDGRLGNPSSCCLSSLESCFSSSSSTATFCLMALPCWRSSATSSPLRSAPDLMSWPTSLPIRLPSACRLLRCCSRSRCCWAISCSLVRSTALPRRPSCWAIVSGLSRTRR